MKTTVNFNNFVDAFRNAGRKDQFSYSALRVLFDYLEQLEDDTGNEMELDVIALCCEFVEADDDEIRDMYRLEDGEDVAEYLDYNTLVCGEAGKGVYVFQQF